MAVIALKLWVIRYLFTHTTPTHSEAYCLRSKAIFAQKFYSFYNGRVYQNGNIIAGGCDCINCNA